MAEILMTVQKDATFPPFHRGPMYSTYAQLREIKLRLKSAKMVSLNEIPAKMNRLDEDFRKENRKPQALMAPKLKPEMRRVGSMSTVKKEVKRDEFLLMRSFSGHHGLPPRKEEDEKRGILRKTFTGLRRSTAKATSWIG